MIADGEAGIACGMLVIFERGPIAIFISVYQDVAERGWDDILDRDVEVTSLKYRSEAGGCTTALDDYNKDENYDKDGVMYKILALRLLGIVKIGSAKHVSNSFTPVIRKENRERQLCVASVRRLLKMSART